MSSDIGGDQNPEENNFNMQYADMGDLTGPPDGAVFYGRHIVKHLNPPS
jgi:hypothetical protein